MYGTMEPSATDSITPVVERGEQARDSLLPPSSHFPVSHDDLPARRTTYWRPLLLVTCMFGIHGLGYFMSNASQTQIFEDIVCRQYYASADLNGIENGDPSTSPERLCKVPAVQEVVAQLFGMSTFFDGIPGLLLAIPYGACADRIGRKPVLTLSMMGLVASGAWVLFVCWTGLPLQFVWFSSAISIIGGGGTVAASVMMMIIADVTTEAERSKFFFWMQSAFICAELVGPPVGAVLMTIDPWIPTFVGWILIAFAGVLTLFVPETLSRPTSFASSEPQYAPLKSEQDDPQPSTTLKPAMEFSFSSLLSLARQCYHTFRALSQNGRVVRLVLTFLVADFGRQSLSILTQYISERFSWSLGEASALSSFRAGLQLALLLVIFPMLDRFLIKVVHMAPRAKDLRVAKVCMFLMTMSFFALAFAPRVWIIVLGLGFYTVGSAFSTFARSLVSSLVEPAMIGTLFTSLSVADTAGTLAAGPLVAEMYRLGMHWRGIWHGLPFMLSLVLTAVATIIMLSLTVNEKAEDSDQES